MRLDEDALNFKECMDDLLLYNPRAREEYINNAAGKLECIIAWFTRCSFSLFTMVYASLALFEIHAATSYGQFVSFLFATHPCLESD